MIVVITAPLQWCYSFIKK